MSNSGFDTVISQRNKWLTLAATVIGSAIVLLDSTVVNIALPAMQRALHADAAATQWVVNAYLLLLGPLVLIGGAAADLYGRRRMFVLGIAIFAAASIVGGFSPNVTVLIACRAAQVLVVLCCRRLAWQFYRRPSVSMSGTGPLEYGRARGL